MAARSSLKPEINSSAVWAALALICVAGFLRLIPHPPNFSPIAAIALFGAAALPRMWAVIIPFAAMLLTDAALGFHEQMPAVYAAFAIVTALGFLLKEKRSVGRVALATVSGSLIFFVVTNLSVWAQGLLYPRTMDGLVACFVAAIPFFQNSLAGDLVYTALLFGSWVAVRSALAKTATVS